VLVIENGYKLVGYWVVGVHSQINTPNQRRFEHCYNVAGNGTSRLVVLPIRPDARQCTTGNRSQLRVVRLPALDDIQQLCDSFASH
jgi:hypothetical protein